eukprot:TRINITY_DN94558_c0_g1_i1.p1 TRINITY_DN94558_c0_g1~~TRINITY_DN94558_c0_g1_i1.p1  ORF type:complete len:248 (+),score=52.00 TRINITY_DN94558_c0_g1_i1:31-744(+)
MDGPANRSRMNLKRLLRCCETTAQVPGFDAASMQQVLMDARKMLTEFTAVCERISRKDISDGFAQRIAALEAKVQANITPTESEAVKDFAQGIPPFTIQMAARASLATERKSVHERVPVPKSETAARAEAEAFGDATAGADWEKQQQEKLLAELGGIVSEFRQRALAMRETVQHDVRSMDTTEALMQTNLSKLKQEGKRLETASSSGWLTTIIYSMVLALVGLSFGSMVMFIIWFRK